MIRQWIALALAALVATGVGACGSITGPPAHGTPYGIEERSHGRP